MPRFSLGACDASAHKVGVEEHFLSDASCAKKILQPKRDGGPTRTPPLLGRSATAEEETHYEYVGLQNFLRTFAAEKILKAIIIL
jgi:hypothetical protein